MAQHGKSISPSTSLRRDHEHLLTLVLSPSLDLCFRQEQQSAAPPEARNIVNFLRNNAGIKTRVGVLNGKRVDYFKGSAAIKALLSPAYQKLKDVPKIEDETDAARQLHNIIPFAFYLRVDRGPSTGAKDAPKIVQINPQQMFQPDLHYAWFYEGSQLGLKLGGLGMVAIMLAGVMFPLWPPTMRLGVWYLSVGVLGLIGLFFVIAILRLIFWLISLVVLKPGVWIFPNLFEDVGFVDSFIPLWAWDVPPPKKEKKAKKAKTAKASEKSAAAKQQAVAVSLLALSPFPFPPSCRVSKLTNMRVRRARSSCQQNLPGAPQRAQAPATPEAAATSAPASQQQPQQKVGSGGPGASDSLDDIN